jgi:hypothetical protein
MLGGTRGR